MSAVDFMRQFFPDLTDWQVEVLLAAAEQRRDAEVQRWERRQWRRVGARQRAHPGRSRMRAAYRARHR